MRRVWKYVLGGIAVCALGGLVVGTGFVFWITRDLPSYAALAHYEPPITTRVYAGNGTLIGEYARERRIYVPISDVPALVKDAFISAEDKNFYSNPGIDVFGILRAAVNNIRNSNRRPQGASTITQQVARNFLLSSAVNYRRKIREAVLALRINSAFSKDKILELYLNEIFLGENSYGVAAAALNYFDKSLDELTLAQIAYLAALPKGPANYQPVRHKHAAIVRRNWVLDQMVDNGYITPQQAAAAKAEDLVTYQRPLGAVVPDVDYFVEEVRRQLYDKYGEKALYDGGLQVRTTLDTHLQEIAVHALRNGLIAYDHRHGWRGPVATIDLKKPDWQKALGAVRDKSGIPAWHLAVVTGVGAKNATKIAFADGSKGTIPFDQITWARKHIRSWLGPKVTKSSDVVKPGNVVYVQPLGKKEPGEYMLRQIPNVNGAIVAVDPFNGHVVALSGGFSYGSSQFDRAMQAMRQPGSTFKPFVYATALDNGFTPVSKVLDSPFAVSQGPGLPLWTPENYEEGQYLGLTTLRRGIELSRNVMTARLAYEVGMDKIAATAERMGVYDKLPHLLSMSLGAGETTLLRLTTGYAEFVNGGHKLQATLIDRVQDRHGKTIYRFDNRPCPDCNQPDWHGQAEPVLPDDHPRVLDPRTAYQIVSILEGVVQRGTGKVISSIGKPLAGKTGTSSEQKDTWFVGFSPDLAVGVFVGFDKPRSLGPHEQGAVTAAPIFRDFMKAALAGQPPTPFRIPPGVVLVSVNPLTGAVMPSGAPGSILEAFKPGTEPTYQSAADEDQPAGGPVGGNVTTAPDSVNVQVGSGTGGLY